MAPGLPRSAVPLAIRNCSHPGLFCTAPGFTVQAARLKRPHRSAMKRSCTAPRSIVRSARLRFQSLGSKRTPRSAVGGSIPQSTRLRFHSLVSRRTTGGPATPGGRQIHSPISEARIPESGQQANNPTGGRQIHSPISEARFQSLGSKRTIRLAVGRSIPQSARPGFETLLCPPFFLSVPRLVRQPGTVQPGAGGVSPPWDALRTRDRSPEIHRIALGDAILRTTAGSRPPLLKTCVCAPQIPLFTANKRRATRSGGRKPPVACTPHAKSKPGNSSHCTCRCGSANHGGLTIAVLDGVRFRVRLAAPS
jgi:hypothetical protein